MGGAATTLPDAPAYQLSGVRLFGSGLYRGRRWSPAEVVHAARKCRELGPKGLKLHLPPAAPGHEDDDGWREFVGDVDAPGPAERTDAPAAGWVDPDTVRAVPDPDHRGEYLLVGDVVNVPPEMAARVESGEYRFGSSELYDSFTDDFGKDHGVVLRKFSFLGGEVPQVKRLGPLPRPVPMAAVKRFAETRGRVRERSERRGGVVFTYAEVSGMDRASMIAAATAAMPTLSQAFLDGLSDQQLAEFVAGLPTPGAPEAASAPAPAAGLMAEGDGEEDTDTEEETEGEEEATEGEDEDADADMAEGDLPPEGEAPADDAGPSREEMIEAIAAEMGDDPAALAELPDEELQALYDEVMASDEAVPADAAAGPVTEMAHQRNPELKRKYGPLPTSNMPKPVKLSRYSEATMQTAARRRVAAQVRRFSENLERANARVLKTERGLVRREVTQFCEQLVREGRATPAQVKAWIAPLLLKADRVKPAFAFAEGGKTRRMSEYEFRKATLARMPATAVRFGERVPGDGPTTAEAEVRKVERFAERMNFAPKDRAEYVQKFRALSQKKAGFTAREYGIDPLDA